MRNIFCFACMQEISSPMAQCPHCGYNNRQKDNGAGMLNGGRLAGKYLVGRLLGRGGFGATYIGFDENLQRRVAIKEYFPAHLVMRAGNAYSVSAVSGCEEDYKKGLARALKESRMAASLGQISGVVQIYDVFSENNTVYIVMEYIEGKTLTNYVRAQNRRLSVQEAISLLFPVKEALQSIHAQKVIHRDVKPDNIMVRKLNRQTVLLDFGAARVQDGKTVGTSSAVVSPGFAPPEQYNSSVLDARVDQYAFAATLFFTLTGKKPPDVMERMMKNAALPSVRAQNPQVSQAVEKVIIRGMALQPSQRYGSLEEMWKALLDAAEGRKMERSDKAKENLLKGLAAAAAILFIGAAVLAMSPGKSRNPAMYTPGETANNETFAESQPLKQENAEPAAQNATDFPVMASAVPTILPTNVPIIQPTRSPTREPTLPPTLAPTSTPAPEKYAVTGETRFVARASSSYQLKHNSEYTVGADMAVDGDLQTAWNEGGSGSGVGEWISLTPSDGKEYVFHGFKIANGFQYHNYHKGDRWIKNNRVQWLEVRDDENRVVGRFFIEDKYDGYVVVDFEVPVESTSLTFVIRGTWEGSDFTEACISEIRPF